MELFRVYIPITNEHLNNFKHVSKNVVPNIIFIMNE
jgi:hypothetical protein